MTKIKQHKVTCSNCGHEFPALHMYSRSPFISQPLSEEEIQKEREFWERNGVCPKCETKNEVRANLPLWKKTPKGGWE